MLRRHFMINTDSGIPKDEIWYTSYEGQITPSDPTVFGANYLPNKSTFDSDTGQGILKFDGNVTTIGDNAFSYCMFDTITIPNSVTSIGYSAFNTTNLSSIIIPNSVKSIGSSAFEYCSFLKSIIIPNSITSIEDCAFYCSALSSVVIGNKVENIGGLAFSDCSFLTSIEIPNSVTSIGYGAFSYCYELNNISYKGTIMQWNAISKESNWHNDVPTTVVHCTDGDVAI